MRSFLIIVSVFVGLAIAVEFAYLRCLAIVNKMHFYVPKKKKEASTRNAFIGRPELDFDFHICNIDKVRFGDEV